MLIILKWLVAPGSEKNSTQIWRSDKPFDDVSDATLIATVGPGLDTYSDADVIQNQKYYYRLRNIRNGSRSTLSKLFEFEASPYTGPGPARTKFGDEHFGYYGQFPDDQDGIPTLNYVRAIFGLSNLDEDLNKSALHKFAIGGTVRGIFTAPLALGTEIDRSNPVLADLLKGNSISFSMGLHSWSIIIPSALSDDSTVPIKHFPGEVRSMLGVISEMYSRVEDAKTGNSTGDRLIPKTGQVKFYEPLILRYPDVDVKWIISSDWTNQQATAINWTTADGPPPLAPKEMHITTVDYSVNVNWESTLIWPVLVYTGLKGPTD